MVSVVVPTRDRWDILSSCALPAALMQEGVSLEVIVVDDGSTDRTPAELARVDDPRVRVLRNEISEGVAASRNRGIDASRGEWLAFLDDDDVWAPEKLSRQIDAARREGAGFVFSSAVTIDDRRRPVAYRLVSECTDLISTLFRVNVVPGGCSNVIARADVVRRVGCFDERLSMLADWDLWLRLALAAPAARCREVHVGYHQHDRNMAVTAPEAVFRESRYLAAKYAGGRSPHSVDTLAPVQWVAWENFWSGHRARAARILLREGLSRRSWPALDRGLRFAVWAFAPEPLAQWLRRRLHAFTSTRRFETSSPEPPEWLSRYGGIRCEVAG